MSKKTKSIEKLLADAKKGDRFRVILTSVTAPIWIAKDDVFVDANGDCILCGHLARIVRGVALDMEVTDIRDGKFRMAEAEGDYIWVTADYITSLVSIPGPIKIRPDGLSYEAVFNAETGECKVGCQTLTRAGCQQVFVALAAHLGYELSE